MDNNIKPNFSSHWLFELDTIENYAYWDNAFSKEECEKIIEIGKIAGMIDGTTKGGIPGIRNSQVSWIHPCKELDFLYRRLTDCIVSLNKQFFKFDLYGFVEGLQFTHYPAPGGKYGRHVDRIRNFAQRKLSCSIQLSDPETYKGGDFFLYEGELGTPLPKKQGTLIVFPSYILHEVKPVTEGERNSLVAWVSGPSFR